MSSRSTCCVELPSRFATLLADFGCYDVFVVEKSCSLSPKVFERILVVTGKRLIIDIDDAWVNRFSAKK